jgi:23S rRNA (guanosine2251-2'-O)-methyltransferase
MKQVGENYLILHDIRSTQNVGAILRTCDAVGIKKVFFSGITPSPIDRFGRKRSDVAKSALGAEESVDWEVIENVFDLIKDFKSRGFQVLALEQDSRAIDYKKINENFPSDKRLILVGNEVDGVPTEILDLCDVIAEIPMLGQKESLNVSVSFGVFIFRLLEV